MPPSTPYAQVQVSVNGGAPVSGGVDVPSAATLQFSGVSTVGWKQQRFELYEYPEGFATPAGWTLGGDGTIFSTAVTPPLVTLPANTVLWGPWSPRLKINEALSNDATTVPDLTDVATICNMLSPKGQRMLAALEATQNCTPTTLGKAWVRSIQRNQIIIEALLGGGGGGSTPWHNVPRTTKTANYTVVSTDFLIVCKTNTGFTITLPAAPSDGDTYRIKNRAAGVNFVAGNGHNIDGATPYALGAGASIDVTYDLAETEWVITS